MGNYEKMDGYGHLFLNWVIIVIYIISRVSSKNESALILRKP